MSPSKTLAEMGLQAYTKLQHLPLHEKAAVLHIAGTLLQAEAKSTELAQLEAQQEIAKALRAPAVAPIADEHFRA